MDFGESVSSINLIQMSLVTFARNSSLKALVIIISSLVRIFKTSEEDKIKLLFKFFEKDSRKEGISFNDFVVVVHILFI